MWMLGWIFRQLANLTACQTLLAILKFTGETFSCLRSVIQHFIVKEIVEGPPQNLLESVAQLIASTTLSKYPQISAVRVKVGKPHVAVPGPLDYLGVEILRHRSSDMSN
nr:dihydroneopterin aldolase 1-like isoform X2 [Populus alba]XP_034915598.1 dihydroneopterin aldolase 1-like isoform X2 [Populus alba]